MVTQFPGMPALGAGVVHGHRYGVDDGDVAGVGGSRDRQADLSDAADGVGDEVESQAPWCGSLVCSDGCVGTFIFTPETPICCGDPLDPWWSSSPRYALRNRKSPQTRITAARG